MDICFGFFFTKHQLIINQSIGFNISIIGCHGFKSWHNINRIIEIFNKYLLLQSTKDMLIQFINDSQCILLQKRLDDLNDEEKDDLSKSNQEYLLTCPERASVTTSKD